jgi:hypothetical protein
LSQFLENIDDPKELRGVINSGIRKNTLIFFKRVTDYKMEQNMFNNLNEFDKPKIIIICRNNNNSNNNDNKP